MRQLEQLAITAIGMEMGREDARRLAGTDNHSPCPITKQDDGAAILRIAHAGEHIGPNDQHMAGGTRFDELIGNRECVGETGTGSSHVKGRNARYAEQPLQLAGSSREGIFSTGGGQHYHIEIGSGQTGCFQGPQGGLAREGGNGFVSPGNAALTDTGAFHDSLVSTICSRSALVRTELGR